MKASASTASTSGAANLPPHSARQDFLVFRLADREYGIALGKVQELCNFDIVKPRADAPRAMAGVVTLRSRKIAVVNLHEILNPVSPKNSRPSDVVILDIGGHVNGIAVDCVVDVVSVRPEQIRCDQAPGMLGIADINQRAIVLLDADKLTTDFQPSPIQKLVA